MARKVSLAPDVAFEIVTPADHATLKDHVAATLSRQLPELQPLPARGGVIHLYANGPSALDAPINSPSMALNGALGVFKARGQEPDFWAACDPQALVSGFVNDAPKSTRYMVASKCHADVFNALSDRNVSVWHMDDEGAKALPTGKPLVPCAVSITLTALGLLYMLGWRHVEVYGWDGCYIDGKDHAISQGHQASDIAVTVGGKRYKSTRSWACEANDAVVYLQWFPDLTVNVHGPGMIGAILRHLKVPNLEDR